MAVFQTNSYSLKTAPQAEPKQAPKSAPKKPLDYTAATRAPKETEAATKAAFGDLPANDGAKRPDASPKLAVTNAQVVPDSGNAPSPVDPRVQSILDNRLADGKTVKEKIDADAPVYLVKAAQDHYNLQTEKGAPLDAVSKFYLNMSAQAIARNGFKEDAITVKNLDSVFNTELIQKNLDELPKDPDFVKWATEQQANSIQKTIEDNPGIAKLVDPYKQEGENYVNALRRMQSDYITSQDFADGVARSDDRKTLTEDALKALTSLGLNEKEMLGVGNTLVENIRSKYTPDAPKTVIDPNTNKAVATEDGYNLATLPDGTHVALGTDGKAVADKQGHPYVYGQDGSARVDANNAYVQIDRRSNSTFASYGGTRYMVDADGKGKYDAQGRPLAIDDEGGAPVALDADGTAATDKAGNKLVFDPNTGKAFADPANGNAVVIDPVTKAIVQTGDDGKIVVGTNGDPYAADQKTGKFMQDAQGNYVQISKDNVVPGIVPGYVVDKNHTKVVVSPYHGKPMVDPALGKTVILDPKTNTPQLVPLDSNGVPRQTQDGKSIVYNETGLTVVPNPGKGPDWLVDLNGNFVQNANGNYIGVDTASGLAAPVDENGFIKNGSGHVPLWDTKANAPMAMPGGNPVVANEDGNLLMANTQGQTIVEEKSGLPFLLDPKTREVATNPDTGRSLLLNQAGLPVEHNADDGYNYLINPATGTTVKTTDGNVVVTNQDGIPYAVTKDGTAVRNPATGNTIVYGFDGRPAKEADTGYPVEITSGGKAHVIDPDTNIPMAERDPKTGGYQLFNPDGSEATNPDTGNKIQIDPDAGLKMEIDPATSKPVTNAKGNPLAMGADNRPLKTPEGKAVVADLKTGLPVSADAAGNLVVDPVSRLPQVVNSESGVPLADPDTKAPVVADPKSKQPVQVDKDGKIITDPVTNMAVAINTKTGAQVKGPNGELAVNDPRTGVALYYDKQSKLFTVVDPDTSQPVTNPTTGAKTVMDVGSGLPFEVLPDAQGNHIIVDKNGLPVKDDEGNQPYFDKDTGAVVVVNAKGEIVDSQTGKKPEAFDPKQLVYTTPLLMAPPAIAMLAGDVDEIMPAPLETTGKETGAPYGTPGPSGSKPSPIDRAWNQPGYEITPDELAAFVDEWKNEYPHPDHPFSYEKHLDGVRLSQDKFPNLRNIPEAELAAVRSYTDAAWCTFLNKALYTGDPKLLQEYDLRIKAISSGLKHMQEAGFHYKGPSVRYLTLTPDQFASMFKNGGIYTNPQFMSTSTLKKGVTVFNEENTKLKVKHLNGVRIQPVSSAPDQYEVLGLRNARYAVSNVRQAGIKAAIKNFSLPSLVNQATLTELPPGADTVPSKASNWARLGNGLSNGLEVIGSGAQAILGGFQIADGIKDKNAYDIASGALNVGSGGLSIAATAASAIGRAAATSTLALAGAGAVLGVIAGIVDFVGTLDDDEEFADQLEKSYGPLGLLADGWRQKAEEAYREAATRHINPSYQA